MFAIFRTLLELKLNMCKDQSKLEFRIAFTAPSHCLVTRMSSLNLSNFPAYLLREKKEIGHSQKGCTRYSSKYYRKLCARCTNIFKQ